MTRLEEIDRLLTSIDNDISQTVKDIAKAKRGAMLISSTIDGLATKLDTLYEDADKLKSEQLDIHLS